MPYPIAYSLILPRGARVQNLPPKFARDMKKAHTGLYRATLKASWVDSGGVKQKADVLGLLADNVAFDPESTPMLTSLELANNFAWAGYRFAYELFNCEEVDERPMDESEIELRLDASIAEGEERRNKAIRLKVNKQTLKEEPWLKNSLVPPPEDDVEEQEEEEEEEEEVVPPKRAKKKAKPKQEEPSEDEDDVDDGRDVDEDEVVDEVPQKREKAKPDEETLQRRREAAMPPESGYDMRERLSRERQARINFLAGPRHNRYPKAKRGEGTFYPAHRRPGFEPHEDLASDREMKSEVVSLFKEMNALEQSRADALERERILLRDQYQTMFRHYNVLLEESRQHHGHLHDVTMDSVKAANSLTRSIVENHDAHREINKQGWDALLQGIGLVKSSAQGQIVQERQMNEMYVAQLEREFAHQRELAIASQPPPPAKSSGIGSMLAGAVKELAPMLKPVLGLMLAKAQGEAGDSEAEEEGLADVAKQVMTMRGGGAQPDQPSAAPAPTPGPSTLPPKPPLRRPAANPFHAQPTPTNLVDGPIPLPSGGPNTAPPIDAVALPEGIETFALFTERMPIVSRLRLLVAWVTPEQREKLVNLLGDNWNRIVRGSASKSDGVALSNMVMLLGPLTNEGTRKKLRAIMSDGQNGLLEEIERIIRAKFPGLD